MVDIATVCAHWQCYPYQIMGFRRWLTERPSGRERVTRRGRPMRSQRMVDSCESLPAAADTTLHCLRAMFAHLPWSRGASGEQQRSPLRSSERGNRWIAIAAASLILTSCTQGAVPPTAPEGENGDPVPVAVTHEELVNGDALANTMREGTIDPFTADAVQAVQDAIPPDEWSAFVAEIGQLRIGGDMSAMMANRSFRRLLSITGPIYDTAFAEVTYAPVSRANQANLLEATDSEGDPGDPFDRYREEATSYLRGWLDSAKQVVDDTMDAVFNPGWQEVFGGGIAAMSICSGTAGVACPIAAGALIGWGIQGNAPAPPPDPTFQDEFREALSQPPGARLELWLDKVAPCDTQSCEPNPALDTPTTPTPADPLSFEYSVEDQNYTLGIAIELLTLSEATGGVAPIRYSLSPQVPGLQFLEGSRVLIGTPSAVGIYDMTYTATDASGARTSLRFEVSVVAPPLVFQVVVEYQSYTLGTAIRPLMLPEATGGLDPLTYTLGPSVPGLQFDLATRTLNGTPTAVGNYVMTYTATDANDEIATLQFGITVEAPTGPAPLAFRMPVEDQSYTIGTAIEPLMLPEATGGLDPLTYTLGPSVPGLQFDAAARTLTGTPTTAGTYEMAYTATDATGGTDSRLFIISVAPVSEPDPVPILNVGMMYVERSLISVSRDLESTECTPPSWSAEIKALPVDTYSQQLGELERALRAECEDNLTVGSSCKEQWSRTRRASDPPCAFLIVQSSHPRPIRYEPCAWHIGSRYTEEEMNAAIKEALEERLCPGCELKCPNCKPVYAACVEEPYYDHQLSTVD